MKKVKDLKPYRAKSPYTIDIEFYNESSATKAADLEGIERKGERGITMAGKDLAALWEGFLSRYTAR